MHWFQSKIANIFYNSKRTILYVSQLYYYAHKYLRSARHCVSCAHLLRRIWLIAFSYRGALFGLHKVIAVRWIEYYYATTLCPIGLCWVGCGSLTSHNINKSPIFSLALFLCSIYTQSNCYIILSVFIFITLHSDVESCASNKMKIHNQSFRI